MKTLSEKIWDDHLVRAADGEPDLLYIDLHLVHEVTSPQAFEGLRLAGRTVRRPDLTVRGPHLADRRRPTAGMRLGSREVGGDVESLGRGVTSAVVQAIFATILIDAIFALIYMKLDI